MEHDLTDYVDLGARSYVDAHTAYDWEKLPPHTQMVFREHVLPIVADVLAKYVENHPEIDLDWLEGIG
jgi:hypothetical protein